MDDVYILFLLNCIYLHRSISFLHFRATPLAYGSSQARDGIRAVAAGLCHSNMGPEPHLQPTPQLTTTPDPQPTDQGQGSNPGPHGS